MPRGILCRYAGSNISAPQQSTPWTPRCRACLNCLQIKLNESPSLKATYFFSLLAPVYVELCKNRLGTVLDRGVSTLFI